MNKCEICKCNKICDHNNFGFEICDNFIPEDVVEVVRCKDCKYLMFSDCYGECKRYLRLVNPTDFCSSGERRWKNA